MTRSDVRLRCGDRGVLDVALAVHGACCGSGEWYQGLAGDVQLLRDILETWTTPSCCFDMAVRNVLDEAVMEYEVLKTKGKV